MKPFEFKLQTALNLKQKEEDRVKEELQRLTARRREELNRLAVLEGELGQLEDRVRRHQDARVDVAEIKRCLDYLPVMRDRISRQQEIIRQIEADMDKTRQLLVEIMRRRKVLEKLKERHYAQYQLEVTREEQKIIDEMATNGYNRNDSALL
jgi:flagellar FliJ protein